MKPINETLREARDLREAKRFNEAIKMLQTILRPDEHESKVCKELGHLFIDIGELQTAVDMFKRAVSLNPESSFLWNNLGYAEKVNGDLQDAVTSTLKAKKFAKEANEVSAANYNLACYFALLGKSESALTHLESACIADPAIKQWAKSDPDLQSLYNERRFKTILIPSSRDD